jgi:hypothetical protein
MGGWPELGGTDLDFKLDILRNMYIIERRRDVIAKRFIAIELGAPLKSHL